MSFPSPMQCLHFPSKSVLSSFLEKNEETKSLKVIEGINLELISGTFGNLDIPEQFVTLRLQQLTWKWNKALELSEKEFEASIIAVGKALIFCAKTPVVVEEEKKEEGKKA